ncbi:MAG TPA: hypothetical protein DCR93_10505 [Cytophagales bacterium]|nr:hypothetical protein [Cytophagales bacterium]HAP59903.1 hypothetical protein [Cytophagales bacterium]
MKALFFSCLLLFLPSSNSSFDLGAPTIQAICKVTLTNDVVVEGIISFGPGGYEFNYKPHGFCFVHDDGLKQFLLFSLEFGGFTPNSFGAFRAGTSKLYYAENLGGIHPQTSTQFDSVTNRVTQTTTEVDQFQLSESMLLHTRLPVDLYVDFAPEENGQIFIITAKIQSVELLKNPSQEWLDLIEDSRQLLYERQKQEEWEDYLEPVWYHEIIKDQEMVGLLMRYF